MLNDRTSLLPLKLLKVLFTLALYITSHVADAVQGLAICFSNSPRLFTLCKWRGLFFPFTKYLHAEQLNGNLDYGGFTKSSKNFAFPQIRKHICSRQQLAYFTEYPVDSDKVLPCAITTQNLYRNYTVNLCIHV